MQSVLHALANKVVPCVVPIYDHYNRLGNYEEVSKGNLPYLIFEGWSLIPVWKFRDGRIKAEYSTYFMNPTISKKFKEETFTIIETDDIRLLMVSKTKDPITGKFQTLDLFEWTVQQKLWK